MRIWSIKGLFLAGGVACIIASSAWARLATVASIRFREVQDSPAIQWSNPVGGLAVGVVPPPKPFRFLLARDPGAAAPVTDGIERLVKPGGQWDVNAILGIFLKNTGAQPLLWSNSADAWGLIFGKGLPPGSIVERVPAPVPDYPQPMVLAPGKVVELLIPISQAQWLWPRLQDGTYRVRVNYDTRELARLRIGDERTNVSPYKVSGFWAGRLEVPDFDVQVKAVAEE